MKFRNIFIYAVVIGLMSSCGSDYELEDYFDLTVLPGYVAFNGDGSSVNLDDVSTMEGGAMVELNVENPTGSLSDITVEYAFSGTAVFGQDFDVSGASASGGTVVIKHDPVDFNNFDNEDIQVDILTDDVVDGSKTLTVTLVSASNAEGTLAVGRGGTTTLLSTNIVIADINCPSELTTPVGGSSQSSLDYDYVATGDITGTGTVTLSTNGTGLGQYIISDLFAGQYATETAYEVTDDCDVLSGPANSGISPSRSATVTGTVGMPTGGGLKTMTIDVILNCCGANGTTFSLALTEAPGP